MASKNKGLQGQYAGFVTRAIGLVLDNIIILAIIAIINGAIALTLQFFLGVNVAHCQPIMNAGQIFGGTLLCHAANWVRIILTAFFAPVYFGLFWTLGGQSLGQYTMGLRVVRVDGRRMTFWRSIVRWIGYMLSFLALGLGFLWVLWDDRRQGLADKMAKTVVVYAWEARQNEFLLDRIRDRLRRRRKTVAAPPSPVPDVNAKPVRLELVQIVFSTMGKVRDAMNVLQAAIRANSFRIVTSTVLVKDENGALGVVGVSDLAAGDESAKSAAMLAGDPRLKQINTDQLTADLPNGSFVYLIVVEDKDLAPLLKTLSASKIAAHVFDLDTPSHDPLAVSSDGAKLPLPDPIPDVWLDSSTPAPQPAPASATARVAETLSSILGGDT